MLSNLRKSDLKLIAEELGQTVPPEARMIEIKHLIENAEMYKEDPEFVKGVIKQVVEDQTSKIASEQSQVELEKLKLARLEKEIELHTLRVQSSVETSNRTVAAEPEVVSTSLENLVKSVKTLTMTVPNRPEALHLFFQSLEKAFKTKNVPLEFKSEILINLLGDKSNNVLAYASEQEIADYDKLKELIIKEFQPTPRECLGNFKNAVRHPDESHVQFASRLSATFDFYCRLREVNDFKSVCDLVVADKLQETLDAKTREHIVIREGQTWFRPNELGRECDLFHSSRGKSLIESNMVRTELTENKRANFPKNNQKRAQHNERMTRTSVNSTNKPERSCYICGSKGEAFHFARNCPKRFENGGNPRDAPKNVLALGSKSDKVAQSQLQYVELLVDGKKVNCLVDSGSEVIILKKALFPDKHCERTITTCTCFGHVIDCGTAYFSFSKGGDRKAVKQEAALSADLIVDAIIPPGFLRELEKAENPGGVTEDPQGGDDLFYPSLEWENIAASIHVSESDLLHLDGETRSTVSRIISEYKPKKEPLGTDLKMNVILKDEIPVSQRSRRIPLVEQKIVDNQIDEWLREGVIKPSCSDYASPIVLCKKRDGTSRLCVDFRQLNKKVVKDSFPMAQIEEVLDHLGKAKVYTTLDLKNGFFHVPVVEKCTKYLAFVTHNGHYEFLKAPFGLSTSPSVFQRFIYNVFRNLMRDNTVVIYMDDFIIPARDEKEGLEKLKRVLGVAEEYGLEINFRKCQFLRKKIEFLGYVIEDGTIRPSPNKTLAVQNFPEPKNLKQIQSFLGLTGYFRKFIPNYSKVAKPLSDLLRNGAEYKFGPEQREAFRTLKELLSTNPVLHLFKQGIPIELHTDASSHGFGAVLFQSSESGKLHPIHYMSKKTTPQQEKLSSYELEVLAIVEALKKFRNYLLGSKVKIVTDCDAFQKTMLKKDLTPKVARWALLLEEFDYEVVHRSGRQMKHVDALSRNAVMMVTHHQGEITSRVAAAQSTDERLQLLKSLAGQGLKEEYLVKNDVLYKYDNGRELLVVPETLELEIIRKIHSKGHFAVSKTEDILKMDFYIPNRRKRIEQVVANCVECILCNRKRGKGEGLLNPIPKESTPLSTFHIDFIGPLPSTNKNYNHVLSVVDAFTKFVWFYPVKSTKTEDVLQKLRLQQAVFGNPSRVITDRGTAFTSKDFEDYCAQENIQHVLATTGIPRGNGQVERIHESLIPVLAKLSLQDPSKWYKHVPDVQRILNSTTNRSTKNSPFELLTGVKMRNKEDLKILEILEEEEMNALMKDREDLREEARKNILKIQEENRRTYNKTRKKAHAYCVNDLVAIQRTQFGSGLKLRPKFFGPYRVTARKGNDRYQVEKVGHHEGPVCTYTAADHMKPWTVPT